MDDGRIVWTGEMRELAESAQLQEQLMGLSMEAG
jgi:branched-chain amino acid transport system ATP-binding protein